MRQHFTQFPHRQSFTKVWFCAFILGSLIWFNLQIAHLKQAKVSQLCHRKCFSLIMISSLLSFSFPIQQEASSTRWCLKLLFSPPFPLRISWKGHKSLLSVKSVFNIQSFKSGLKWFVIFRYLISALFFPRLCSDRNKIDDGRRVVGGGLKMCWVALRGLKFGGIIEA